MCLAAYDVQEELCLLAISARILIFFLLLFRVNFLDMEDSSKTKQFTFLAKDKDANKNVFLGPKTNKLSTEVQAMTQ